MDRLNIKKYREKVSLTDLLGILIGAFIQAAAIQVVLIPAHLMTGGLTGLAIILKFISGYDVWIWYVALNIPVFIAGYRFVSRRFALYSLLGTIAISVFLGMIQNFSPNINIHDSLLSAVLGGVLVGAGTGLILRSKGSSGGMDIVAVVVKRIWGYSFGETSFAGNMLVIMLFLLTSNIELTLFSAISIFVTARVVDRLESGFSVTKTAMIVSEHSDEIATEVINRLHRGCTYLTGQGAYTGENKKIIMVTVGKTQLPRLKEIVFDRDPKAFITINETIEVYGQGFKSSGQDF